MVRTNDDKGTLITLESSGYNYTRGEHAPPYVPLPLSTVPLSPVGHRDLHPYDGEAVATR